MGASPSADRQGDQGQRNQPLRQDGKRKELGEKELQLDGHGIAFLE
jgi:hypothetical protein